MDLFEQKEILRRMLFETCGHQKDISLVHIEQLLTLMGIEEGNSRIVLIMFSQERQEKDWF